MNDRETTDFGFEQVSKEDKTRLVAGVFDSVARRYDLMNDVMSAGIHRLWKRFTLDVSGVRPGHTVLDIAGGTGDLSRHLSQLVGATGQVVLADINASMLHVGRERLLNQGIANNVFYTQANAECLPFPDHTFDCLTIAFGLRNVSDKCLALRSMLRILKPGGRLLILEFSKPTHTLLEKAYDLYSFKVLPLMGKLLTQDADSYRYLAESIRMHPDQQRLKTMMEEAGFSQCQFYNMSGGIVALHKGIKA